MPRTPQGRGASFFGKPFATFLSPDVRRIAGIPPSVVSTRFRHDHVRGTITCVHLLRVSMFAGLLAALATAVLSYHRWPGPHPRGLGGYEQRWAERKVFWEETPMPADLPPAVSKGQLALVVTGSRSFRGTYNDPAAVADGRYGRDRLNPPVEVAGRMPSEVFSEALRRNQEEGRFAYVWTEEGLLLTRPELASDRTMAKLDVSELQKRWWSPALLRNRQSSSNVVANDVRTLIANQIMADIEPESWGPKSGSIAIGSSEIWVYNTNRNVAAVQDLFWRINLQALLFDCAIVGVFAAIVVGILLLADHALRRWHRARRGQCLACGYDLRGTPDRCPECSWTSSAPTGTGRNAASPSPP